MSDAPDAPPDIAGGKQAGDPGMEGATETGSGGTSPGSGPDDNSSSELPGEKGGAASGGGT